MKSVKRSTNRSSETYELTFTPASEYNLEEEESDINEMTSLPPEPTSDSSNQPATLDDNSRSHALPVLNAAQREAVACTSGNLLIIASAGTGKTTTLVERYVNLVKNHGYQSDEIMMTTFTNKAAKDMMRKIKLRTGHEPPFVGTMHALFLSILRTHVGLTGLNPGFTILEDEGDKRAIVKQILAREKLFANADSVKYFTHWIGKFKNRGILASELSTDVTLDEDVPTGGKVEELFEDDTIWVDPQLRAHVNRVYKLYQEELGTRNVVDFDDILLLTYKLLKEHSSVREHYCRKFRAIMVDEAQDLNVVQKNILNLLRRDNLCLIGDDCQNIYEWRGSSNDLVFDFSENEKTVFLKENYRSDKQIIDSVNKVIASMRFKIDKQLECTKPGKGTLAIESFITGEEELAFIVDELKALRAKGVRPDDIAVLFRTNRIGKEVERALKRARIPCQLARGKDFFEREEVKDVLAFLKVRVNPRSLTDFMRLVLLVPSLGKTSAQKLVQCAKARACTLVEALSLGAEAGLRDEQRQELRKLQTVLQMEGPPIATFMRVFGYGNWLRSQYGNDPLKLEDKVANIEVLTSLYAGYANDFTGTSAFLDSLIELGKKDDTRGKVVLSTIHSAKGLEWEHVFLVSCNEKTLPFYTHDLTTAKRDSELRLFYVAISRAKKALVISHHALTRWGKKHERSQFIDIVH